uniref:Uncharacterized protein n=1 Tax=Cannabis sativa TaxID=3483 RepID=A0A803PYB7_CANSA
MHRLADSAAFCPTADPAPLLGLRVPWPASRITGYLVGAGPSGGGGSDGPAASSPQEVLATLALTRLVGSSEGPPARTPNLEDMFVKRKVAKSESNHKYSI